MSEIYVFTNLYIGTYSFIAISKYTKVNSNRFNHCRPNEHKSGTSNTQEWQRVTLGTQEHLCQYNSIETLQVSCSNFGMLTAILVTHQMPRWQSTLQNRFIVKTSFLECKVSNWHTQRYNYLQFLQIVVQTSSANFMKQHNKHKMPGCPYLYSIHSYKVSTKVCYGLQDAIFVPVMKLDILLTPFSKVIFWDTLKQPYHKTTATHFQFRPSLIFFE